MSQSTKSNSSSKLADLMKMNKSIAGSLDESEVLNNSLKMEKDIVDAETGSILLLDDSGEYLHFAVALGDAETTLKDHRVKVGQGIAGYVAEQNEPVLIEDTETNEQFDEYFDSQTGFDTNTVMCVPIQSGDELLGVAEVINKTDDTSFDEDDLFLFCAFAGQIAVAVENARMHEDIMERERLRQEVKTAKKVQKSYLPDRFPDCSSLSFSANLESAHQVSGDFYDCFELDDGNIAYVLGDVSGKGLPAAMYMCRVLTELRAGLKENENTVEVMEEINQRLVETSTQGMFVTMLLFIVDRDTNTVDVVNGGHLPYFHRRGDELDVIKKGNNPPLGIQPYGSYSSHKLKLQDDSVVVAFTDGVTEARNPSGEMFEMYRTKRIMEETRLPPNLMVEKIFQSVKSFCDTAEQKDDITAISFGGSTLDNRFDFEMVSDPSYLNLVRNSVTSLLSRTNVSDKLANEIQVGIVEAVSNIIEHTYHNRKTGRIQIRMNLEGQTFICHLRDFGPQVDPDQIKGRDLDDVKPGGLGVHLMNDLFDQCEYDTELEEGNCLVMRKELNSND